MSPTQTIARPILVLSDPARSMTSLSVGRLAKASRERVRNRDFPAQASLSGSLFPLVAFRQGLDKRGSVERRSLQIESR
jgi:hypothetical protein